MVYSLLPIVSFFSSDQSDFYTIVNPAPVVFIFTIPLLEILVWIEFPLSIFLIFLLLPLLLVILSRFPIETYQ